MADNGLAYIKLNGVDILSDPRFVSCDFQETIEGVGEQCIIVMELGLYDSYTWTPFNSQIIIKDTTGEIPFEGVIFDDPVKIDGKGIKYLSIKARSRKADFKNEHILGPFPPETLCSDAIQSLLTEKFSNHFIGLIDDDLAAEECVLEFSGESLLDAIKMIIGLVDKEIRWYIDYDETLNEYTHNFVEAYTTNIGSYTKIEDISTPFIEDKGSITNAITMSSNRIEAKEYFPQEFYFEGNQDYSLKLGGSQDQIEIPLEFVPSGAVKLFLLIGKSDTLNTIFNATKYELRVDPFDEDSSYDFDLRRMLQSLDPSYMSDTSTGQTTIDGQTITQSVKRTLYGKYTAEFSASHNTESIAQVPSSTNGYILAKSKVYLVNNLQKLNEEIGQNITEDDILGYLIWYPYQVNYVKYFEDETSILTYGKQYKNIGVKQFASIKAFDLYGQAYITANKEPKKSGVFNIMYYDGSTFNIRPRLQTKCNVTSGWSPWDANDVEIRAISHKITTNRWYCKVSAEKNPSIGFLEEFMKGLLRGETTGQSSVTKNLTITESLTLTDGTITLESHTEDDMQYDKTNMEYLEYV